MPGQLSRRKFIELGALGAGLAASAILKPRLSFAADATPAATPVATENPLPPAPAAGPIDLKTAGGMDALVAAAKKEGGLNVITLPDDWADYGEVKKIFFDRYGLTKSDLIPQGSSGDEIAAIKANAGNTGPQNPDVIDVGFIWGAQSKAAGLLQPYKVATWDTIPDALKDADGYYWGDYYGTMSFEVNTDVVKDVPQDWSDLLKPAYKGLIGIGGDPTSASQAVHAVWAAALANGGSLDDPTPGLQFFKKLAEAGNLNGAVVQGGMVAKGEIPIGIRWDFNTLQNRDNQKDTANIQVVYPTSGSIAGVYLQGINAYAPHPLASRLWQEFLYSDEGQLLWLKGYAKPVRFDDLMKRKAVPADLLAKLPKLPDNYKVGFPTVDQIKKALPAITSGWPTVVGVSIKSGN
jgi:putative spermidine/putrescine transport system substrate-binding protein